MTFNTKLLNSKAFRYFTMVQELNATQFKEEISKDEPILVDFFATWCGPCMQLAPIFDKVSNDYSGKLKFAKMNIENDENQQAASEHGVMNIPCLILFKNGKEVDRIVGALQETQLKEKIDSILASI